MIVIYKPTGRKHTIKPQTAEQWRKAGFDFEIIEAEEKPKAIKEREPKEVKE